jgi:hypothetical protein
MTGSAPHRRAILGGIGLFAMFPIQPSAALSQYRWRNRVLVLQVRNLNQLALSRQKALLRDDQAGLKIRDMVVFAMTQYAVAPVFGVAPGPSDHTDIGRLPPGMDFRATLIGKDGGVKARWEQPVSLAELYGVIDVMPMRRREMRTRGG